MKDFNKVAVIDHVGKVVNPDGSDLSKEQFSALYKKIFSIAEEDGYVPNKTVVTLKNLCKMNYNPRARKPLTDKNMPKIKYAMRYQANNVEQVYFICPFLYKKAEDDVRKWFERGIPVRIYETKNDALYDYEKFYATTSTSKGNSDWYEDYSFDWNTVYSPKRRILDMWAIAIGADLDAPCIRYQKELVPENYIERPERKQLRINPDLATVDPNETHFTKPFTSEKGFLSRTRCSETEKKVNIWFESLETYAELAGGYICMDIGPKFGAFVGGDKAIMNSLLEPDWIVCEECGRPMKIRKYGESGCDHCGAEYTEDVTFSIYYEDAYIEDYEDYLGDDIEDTLTEEEYFEQLANEY